MAQCVREVIFDPEAAGLSSQALDDYFIIIIQSFIETETYVQITKNNVQKIEI